jgi:hypothetical protein
MLCLPAPSPRKPRRNKTALRAPPERRVTRGSNAARRAMAMHSTEGQRLWSLGEFPNRQAAAHMGVVEKVSCGSWVFFIDPLL